MAQRRKLRGRQGAEIAEGREEPVVVSAECIVSSEGLLYRAGGKGGVSQEAGEQ